MAVHAGFELDKVAPGQVFLRVLQFSHIGDITSMLLTHIALICHRRCTVLATECVLSKNTSLLLSLPAVSVYLQLNISCALVLVLSPGTQCACADCLGYLLQHWF
jgi:hypothetical protein